MIEIALSAYTRFRVQVEEGVAFVTIDNPPINLMDVVMMKELGRLARDTAQDASVRVVVFRSDNPDFFIAHADVGHILRLPIEPAPRSVELNGLHRIMEAWRRLPKPTIAQIEGIARGGGSELALSLDMRFAAIGRAILGQPEVALGIFPGGGGSQRLPQLLGRGRALEVILGCQDMDAEVAERYGYINRALRADEIGDFVARLARRIATFPPESVRLAKEAVDASLSANWTEGLLEEAYFWQQAYITDEAQARMRRFLERGGQTREKELDWNRIGAELSRE